MRPDSIQAMAKAVNSVPLMNTAPHTRPEMNVAKTISVGSPTDTSHGAE